MKTLVILILCSINGSVYGKSLSVLLKEKLGENLSSVDHVMSTKEEDQGMFGLIGENLSHFQDMVYDVNGQLHSMMETGGIPIVKQTIDTLRLWQRQTNRFTKEMKSMPGQLIELEGLKIHYEKVGTGPNVLLLLPGGIGTSRSDFSIQLSEGNGLSRKLFTMIAWDPPGYGFSRPPVRVYDKDVYKRDADLAAKLMQKLGYNFYSVLGWSDGGKTGLLMAIRHPARIDKLVIWGANAYVVEQEKRVMNTARNIDLWNPQTRGFYEMVYGNELKVLWNKHCDHYINNLADICRNEVHSIRCPTFVLHGDLDPVPKEHPKFLTDKISDSRLHRFPKGAHNLHQEFSDEFNKVVTDFLLEESFH